MSFHDHRITGIDGTSRSLEEFRGQVVLVVNVASKCGLTPQYAGLQKIHDAYRAKGFSVLGFPCNQFAGQEPGTEAEIQDFCETRYDVRFPLSAKVEVNGPGRDPLYAWLTSQASAPDGPGDIQWNFAKFVVDRDGRVAARFAPQTPPEDPALCAAIEGALRS